MGAFTTFMLVGPPCQSGIRPTHMLSLSENDEPRWVLEPYGAPREARVWTPASVATIMEDALLMVALHVTRDAAVLEAARTLSALLERSPLQLAKLDADALQELRTASRFAKTHAKIVLTILDGSTCSSQREIPKTYGWIDSEVLGPS